MTLHPLYHGLGLGLGLFFSIGMQNAYILRCGLRRQHVFAVSLTCFLCDVVLLALGGLGLGHIFGHSKTLTTIMTLLGAAFVLGYGIKTLYQAFTLRHTLQSEPEPAHSKRQSLQHAISVALAVTLLNPHVYLDAFVIVGSNAAPYIFSDKILFTLGCLMAAGIVQFGLGGFAHALAPILGRPQFWKWIEATTGLMMLIIAGYLIKTLF